MGVVTSSVTLICHCDTMPLIKTCTKLEIYIEPLLWDYMQCLIIITIIVYLNGMNDFSEGQFSGESKAVINNGLSLFKVGHIQCCKKKNKIYHTD